MTLRANIWKFYTLRIFLRSMVFPVLVIYFLRSGLSAAEIGLVFSIGVLVSFFLELPSGYISDKIGHKQAMIACFILKAISMLCYLGGTFWWFVLADILFVGGGALWSGTGEAFFYETLKDLNKLEDFEKLFGRSMIVSLSAGSGLLILMPFIYAYSNNLVFYINSALLLIPIIISLTLKQPSYSKSVSKIEGWWGMVHEWRSIGQFVIRQKRYRALVLFFAFWQAAQNAFDSFSQIFFTFLNVPTKLFGVIYASNRILQGVGGQLAYLLKRAMSLVKILGFFSMELVIFFFVGAYATQLVGVILFPVRNFFEGMSVPIRSRMFNDEITEGNRVTLLSVEPALRRLIEATLVFIFGLLFNAFSVPYAFFISGFGVMIIMFILFMSARKEMRVSVN